jgi:hypothetical protein
MVNPPLAIYDIADVENQLDQMEATVELLATNPDLGFSLTHTIATFIGGLAKAERGRDRETYKEYLEEHFSTLCQSIPPEMFYEKVRNGTVHKMVVRPPYALHHDKEEGDYIRTVAIGGVDYHSLNVDRLKSDFLRHVRSIRQRK